MNNDNPEKWEHIPAPELPEAVLEAVTRCGGILPFNGKPLFRLEWGMTATKFGNGKTRLRYPARGRRIKRYYGLRKDFAVQVVAFIEESQRRQTDNFMNLRFSETYQIIEATPFIKEKGIQGIDYIILDASESVQDLARTCALRDFTFFSDTCVFEQIGKPFWYLQRFMVTPEMQKTVAKGYGTMLESKGDWNARRFGVGHCPETGDERFLDLSGAYPEGGDYLADFFCYETAEELTVSMVEEVINRYISAREALSERYKSDKDFRINEQYQQDLEEFDNENLEWEESFEDMFWNAVPAFDSLGIFTKGRVIKTI